MFALRGALIISLLVLLCMIAGCYGNLVQRGLGYELRGDYISAIGAYRTAANETSDPEDKAIAQGQLGRLYALLGKHKEAMETLKEAKADLPSDSFNYADVCYALGLSYYEAGKDTWSRAAREFEETIEIYPETLEMENVLTKSHFYLSVIYWHQKKHALAQVHLQEAMVRERDSPGLFLWAMGPAPVEKEVEKETVTCLPFSNDTGNRGLDWLSNAIPESLIAKLDDLEFILLVDSAQLEEVLKQLGLSASDVTDPDNALRIGKLIVAKTIIYGSYQRRSDSTLAIIARATDVETGTILRVVEEIGSQSDVVGLMERIGDRLIATIDPSTRYTQTNAQLIRGSAYIFRRGYHEGIRTFEEALRVEPDWAQAHNNLANTYALTSDYGAAIEQYRQALELNPDWPEACYNLARAYSLSGDKNSAREWLRKTIALNQEYISLASTDAAFRGAQFRDVIGTTRR